MAQKYYQIGKQFVRLAQQAQRDEVEETAFIKRFSTLLSILMIRRTGDSTWFGDEMVHTVPHQFLDIDCPLYPSYREWVVNAQDTMMKKRQIAMNIG
jgi:hypothetical protein